MLVYGVLLVVVGATASGLAMLVSADAQTMMLNASVNTDASLVRSFVNLVGMRPSDVDPSLPDPSRTEALDRGLRVLTQSGQLIRIAILTPDGRILAMSGITPKISEPVTPGMAASIQGQTVSADIVARPDSLDPGSAGPSIVREYVPILLDGQVKAVVEVWRDAGPILSQLEDTRFTVVAVTLGAATICAILLYLIFRSAQGRLGRQAKQLLEASRHDPLTGALNHGAIVEELTRLMARAEPDRSAVGLALVDIDNFKALNDTYSHQAGDQVILDVFRLLQAWLPPSSVLGRYGPDEFLVITEGSGALHLEHAMESVRTAAAELTFTFESSERLPVNISAGLCFSPTNGESVTSLLSVAARTLDEARVSGGDTVRVAEAGRAVSRSDQTFNVLQSLVIAVDTKDHYTRRHSEDVARYADFIAELMGLDRDFRQALRAAGLLHDIGKIGIPDVMLRKPGRLTYEEAENFRQHVSLGDMIVRDLDHLPIIKAGIRYHHERWDGKGYLEGLAGEGIPLVARILAVGDAFSAMTTTRPYRKALPLQEAFTRLGDAAGSQLDETIVKIFLDGFEAAENPPLPGTASAPRPWTLHPEAA
jgi:diguanylate cyclase (GGDEF)-like protein/putative nucleotidyltransferase with HDIG domain